MIILKKSHKIIAGFLVVLLALIASLYFMEYRQNIRAEQGYCTWKAEKKGLIIARDQRLDLAINRFLQDQISFDYREIELVENNGRRVRNYWEYFKDHFTLMRYNSKEEILKENPQCCALVGADIPPPSGDFWGWSSNPGTSVFEIKHKIRYTDQNSRFKEIVSSHTYFAVDNCGGVEPIFPL